MRRVALYSDIHANVPAYEAVMADIDAATIEERYCLGDLVGYGPDPAAIVQRMREVDHPVIRGNYDDGIGNRLGECGCYYATKEAKEEGKRSYARTDASLDDAERDFLASLIDDVRFREQGARVLLCHGSPRLIYEYLMPDRPDSNLAKLADDAEADIVCVGHVHIPYHRRLPGGDGRQVHYISDGSVGLPRDGDPRGCWAELVFGTKAEVAEACPEDEAAGPVGTAYADRLWLGVIFHRVPF